MSKTTPDATGTGGSKPSFFGWMTAPLEAMVDNRLSMMILSFIIGVVMIIAASRLNIGSVTFDGVLHNGCNIFAGTCKGDPKIIATKEVGYFYALNWSVFGCIISPIITFCGLGVLRSIKTTMRELCAQGLVRDSECNRLSFEAVEPKLEGELRKSRMIFLFIFVLVMAFMLSDWWDVVGKPILNPDQVRAPLSDPSMEYDWSVASLYKNVDVDRWQLFAFGLIGYILLAGFVPAFAFAVVISAVFFVAFLNSVNGPSHSFNMAAISDAKFADRHFGFRNFDFFFTNLLATCIAVLAGLWLMLVQNVYLRDATHTDIVSFLLTNVEFANQIRQFKVLPDAIWTWIWQAAPSNFGNIQVILSVVLTPIVFILSIGTCWVMLRGTAMNARKYSRQHTTKLAKEIGVTEKDFRAHLKKMKIWPVGWISVNELIGVMAILFFSLISYRVAVFALLALVLRFIAAVIAAIWSFGDKILKWVRDHGDEDDDEEEGG